MYLFAIDHHEKNLLQQHHDYKQQPYCMFASRTKSSSLEFLSASFDAVKLNPPQLATYRKPRTFGIAKFDPFTVYDYKT